MVPLWEEGRLGFDGVDEGERAVFVLRTEVLLWIKGGAMENSLQRKANSGTLSLDMLEQLFGSRTRVKLLSLFLRYPHDPMFVRELTRKIDTQINAVRRELANLAKLGLIVEIESTEEADPEELGTKKTFGVKRKYYMANPAFPLLPELTSLIIKSQLMLEKNLDQEIQTFGDIRYLAFLGVFIGKPKAPVDIFIVSDTFETDKLRDMVKEMEHDLGVEINFSVMPLAEFRYRKEMTDKFLYAILEAQKNVVIDRLNERAE